ncbi:hypothetical protein KIN20_035031 [Parelaphostrongylus tenuis]|uniref:Major facilitator superfamily (MFS) profile domain-containing protein n=1 Tax=Parelaphostrongylus tenuis TaxID=148309 RepID=A0AAD5RB10_PARTN|nr:hypothetical protein KIN20_035031 [Parelaphostrongylus tenuis]
MKLVEGLIIIYDSDNMGSESPTTKEKSSNSPWPNWKLSLMAFLVSLGGGFNFGYQLVITNPAQKAFIQFLNTSYIDTHGVQQNQETLEFIWGVIASAYFWGATVGALLIQTVADRMGRKKGILVMFILQIICLVITIASYFISSYIIYTVSRVALGITVSISLGIGPMFIIECSPMACRGMISMATGFLLQLGRVAGSITGMPETMGTVDHWWLMYALELGMTIFITVLLFFVPESPSFLLTKNKPEEAKRSYMYYQSITEAEAKLLVADAHKTTKGEPPVGLFGVFMDKTWRCGFLVSAVVMGGTLLCGIVVVNAFAFDILLNVGLDGLHASLANIAIWLMAAIGAVLSGQLVERLGRRPLLLWTFFAMAIVDAAISGLMYLFEWTSSPDGNAITTMAEIQRREDSRWIGWCVVVSISAFILLFATGPGPVCFLVPGELVGQRARAATYTWMNIIMNGIRALLIAVYFPIRAVLGAPLSYFLLFFPSCLATVAICYYWLPETSGKTPEQAKSDVKDLPKICGSTRKSYDIKMDNMDQQQSTDSPKALEA